LTDFQPPPFLRNIQKSPIRQISDRAKPGDISLGLGEPDLPTPDVIRNAAIKVIAEEQNGYTLQAGLPALRERVASDYPQLNLTADDVVITAGSQEALYLALMTLIKADDEVLIPDPGFVAYATIVRMAGGIPVTYRMPAAGNFSFDAAAFRQALTKRTTLVVCVSPSNPTGRTLSASDLAAIAAELKGTGIYLLSDEIYRDIYYGNEPPPTASTFYDRTIVISGLSKSMSMTGWRLGWICGDAAVIRAALVLHGYVTTCASTVSQKAALAAWTAEGAAARASIRQTFHQRRDYLVNLIKSELGLNAVTPDGAFYTMVDVRNYGSSVAVAEKLLEHGVITVPGSAFGNEGEGFLRISFCADTPKLAEGVARMKRAFASPLGAASP
jgi:aspartate/methionine/tyrosine aminotransferase